MNVNIVPVIACSNSEDEEFCSSGVFMNSEEELGTRLLVAVGLSLKFSSRNITLMTWKSHLRPCSDMGWIGELKLQRTRKKQQTH